MSSKVYSPDVALLIKENTSNSYTASSRKAVTSAEKSSNKLLISMLFGISMAAAPMISNDAPISVAPKIMYNNNMDQGFISAPRSEGRMEASQMTEKRRYATEVDEMPPVPAEVVLGHKYKHTGEIFSFNDNMEFVTSSKIPAFDPDNIMRQLPTTMDKD